MKRNVLPVGLLAWLSLYAIPGVAQNLLTNADFELGEGAPVGWRIAGGNGAWTNDAVRAGRQVTVRGDGQDQSQWQTGNLSLPPGACYRLSFLGRRLAGAKSGTAVAGLPRANRDFPLDESWQRNGFVFQVPHDDGASFVRLGQWHVDGQLAFDDAWLIAALPVHRRTPEGFELGEGESLSSVTYRFQPRFGWSGSYCHRPLFSNRASFNSDRWVFGPKSEVVYRFGLPQRRQKTAKVEVTVSHHEGGILKVEVSPDASAWVVIGELAQLGSKTLEVPSTLLPAEQVFVRLSAAGETGAFQVNRIDFTGELDRPVSPAVGDTQFLEVLETHPELSVRCDALTWQEETGEYAARLAISHRGATPPQIEGKLFIQGSASGSPATRAESMAATNTIVLRCPVSQPGEHGLDLVLREANTGRTLFAGRTTVRVGWLSDRRGGYWLSHRDSLGVWWCESGWKVGRQRGLPPETSKGEPMRLSLAQGEYEALQLVLRPDSDQELREISVDEFRSANGKAAAISVRVDEVAYVPVTQPTDGSCQVGEYPDPLPPLRLPLRLVGGQNQPLWITVCAPPELSAGTYRARLQLRTATARAEFPIELTVYGFGLPAESHLHSALGLGAGEINLYHRLTNQADQEAVFAKYLRNFSQHRISPYSFYDYAPMTVNVLGEGADKRVKVDFNRFDVAAREWLRPGGFNTFQLPLQGMGGGTFHSRHLGQFGGFAEGTPEHARLFHDYLGQVQRHLETNGWLRQAFTYWFDEPDPKDYEFVVAGMKRLKEAAPGIRRMLTEQPEAALAGYVDIWCGLTPEWTPERVKERRALGEAVWWYICTGPKAPYVTEFIDHPGTELRLWPWQSWQYGVEGILVWATIYWTSPLAYPRPALQDPWKDPMSWVTGYGYPVGHQSPWGNGDGRFLYPPRRDANTDTSPCLDEPINSVRWENLRDGMEDYEYLWLLQEWANTLARSQPNTPLLSEARALLVVPEDVSRNLTEFTTDPRPILRHRDKLARMIERVQASVADAPIPLARAHSHNDYEHARPLLDALDQGFCSVEADIYLVDGELLVAHDRDKVRRDRTLEGLYLAPLRQRVRENAGRVYRGGPPCTLLIDLKTEGESTCAALEPLLAAYRDILTEFRADCTLTNAVTVVLSGNRPLERLKAQRSRYAGIDGRMTDLTSNLSPHLVPLVSDNFSVHFTWRGAGPMPAAEYTLLRAWVDEAHRQGRRIRFWAVPDQALAWQVMLDAGVDYINTDRLADLASFLKGK